MKSHCYDLTIQAETEKEADDKMSALTTLAKKLNVRELRKLEDIVKNDPQKLELARKFLGL